jgi:hypothetical protein
MSSKLIHVSFATQAIVILREIKPLTGHWEWVFPSGRSLRTILDEVLGFRPELMEQRLAHAVKDPLGRAYNRTKYLDKRHKMMQQWADYLDKLKDQK